MAGFVSSASPEMTVKMLLLLLIIVALCRHSPPTPNKKKRLRLQDGGDGGVASPESGRLKGLEGGVGDGGEAQRRARHPGDIVETA